MLKNILNLEGAQELSKEQQKAVTGGKRYRNMIGTGGFYHSDSISGAVGCECTWQEKSGLFGNWVDVTGPCPADGNLEYSCVPA